MSKTIISTKNAPGAIGPYSQGIAANGFIFTSGQLPLDPETGDNEKRDIRKAAKRSLENVSAILAEAGLDLSDVVKTTVFMEDLSEFAAMNEVYASFFQYDCPARSCFQVAALPMGSIVEIEVIAALRPAE